MRWAILALAALALSGCESTAEKSAKLEREAKLAAAHEPSAPSPVSALTHPSTKIRVGAVTILHGSEGLAAVVPLENTTASALRNVPVVLVVRAANGQTVYSNAAPGQGPGLASAPLIPAHGRLNWIDDQVQASGEGQTAKVTVGEVPAADGPIPHLSVSGAHLIANSSSGPAAEGEVVNHSSVAQSQLVVYAIARRAGKIVAAGRAVLEQVPAGSSVRFQLFFVGEPAGGQLEVTAPPSSF